MIDQYEVPALIAAALPEMEKELRYSSVVGNINDTMMILTRYTKELVLSHEFSQVKKCMRLAGQIYQKGNNLVKGAVENVFIYSFSVMRMSCNQTEWSALQANIPTPLYTAYMNQVMRSGC